MQDFQNRVIAEKEELDLKLGKLEVFLVSAHFFGLDDSERARLKEQHNVMQKYSSILGRRIAAFKE